MREYLGVQVTVYQPGLTYNTNTFSTYNCWAIQQDDGALKMVFDVWDDSDYAAECTDPIPSDHPNTVYGDDRVFKFKVYDISFWSIDNGFDYGYIRADNLCTYMALFGAARDAEKLVNLYHKYIDELKLTQQIKDKDLTSSELAHSVRFIVACDVEHDGDYEIRFVKLVGRVDLSSCVTVN